MPSVQQNRPRVCTADEALARVRSGMRVFIGSGCAAPQKLVAALASRGPQVYDVEIMHILTFGDAPYARKDLLDHFRHNAFFIGPNVREAVNEGVADFTPIFLSEIPALFRRKQMHLDVALVQVSPPDEHGYCSYGVSVDVVKAAVESAGCVIAEVNRNMPRTLGDSFVHISELDALVESDLPILEHPFEAPSPEETSIGEFVATLVENGSTLQTGIGEIPSAVMAALMGKRDLGMHTEMFTEAIMPLIEAGVLNGKAKSLLPGKVVASFCFGGRKLFDYIHNNPVFEFRPTEFTNDPYIIAQNVKMVAISSAIEVDLTGQVCSDSIGERFYSGIGGQVDFNRGAAKSRGGKAIIALPSTAKNGTVSRIRTHLSPGAGVVTTRAGVHYVVTEYGVAYLHGKSVQERALALLSVAHPKFRAELLKEAIAAKYLSAEMADKEGKILVGPKELKTTYLLNDGTQLNFRPIHPTDEPRMRDLFYKLSAATIYYRFMSHQKRVSRHQIQDFVYIDHRNDVTIVGTLPESHGEEIIAIGSYYLDVKTNLAEVAFTVSDKWQNHGIGTFLLKHLMRTARRNGIRGFTAEVLVENKPMQAVINKSNTKVSSKVGTGVVSFEMAFE